MLPNERTSLDGNLNSAEIRAIKSYSVQFEDCRLRFHELIKPDSVAPASGSPALLKEFAHMAAIGWTQTDGKVLWNCGGTLIWMDFVLTAAHCVVDHR